MKTTICIRAGALVLAMIPALAAAQGMTRKKVADVGAWVIEANSAEGQTMSCAAIPPGGARTAFEISSEGWTVALPVAATGDEIKGSIDIDGKPERGSLYRRDDGRMSMFLKAPQIRRLAGAKAVTVTAGAEKR